MFLLRILLVFLVFIGPAFSISSPDLDAAINKSLIDLKAENRWAINYYTMLLEQMKAVKSSNTEEIKHLRKKLSEPSEIIVSESWKNYFLGEVLTCFELAIAQNRRSSAVAAKSKGQISVDIDLIKAKAQQLFSEQSLSLFLYLENPSAFIPLDTCNQLAFLIMLQEFYNLSLEVLPHIHLLYLTESNKEELFRRSQFAKNYLKSNESYLTRVVHFW
jgi:hypothetical protein